MNCRQSSGRMEMAWRQPGGRPRIECGENSLHKKAVGNGNEGNLDIDGWWVRGRSVIGGGQSVDDGRSCLSAAGGVCVTLNRCARRR